MKKLLYFLIISALLSGTVFFSVNALDYNDIDNLENDIKNELRAAIDDDTLDVLSEIGLKEFSFYEVYDVSLKNISKFFSVALSDKVKVCFKVFFEMLSIVMLTGVITTLFKNSAEGNIISNLSVIIITLLTVNVISDTLSAVISVLEMSGKFILSFVPVYTLLISLTGNAASALTYNTFVMGFAELISILITSVVTKFIGVFFCLGISFSLGSVINTSKLISSVNKAVSTVLGLSASLFTGVLGLKSLLSASVDSISVRGIRFLIGSLIPVVGSSISEAYSSLVGSINLIKGSVAIVGILVVIIINIPIIIETLAYYISFNALGYVAELVCASKTGEILKCFSCGMRILLLLCVFEMFILIISTGVMLSIRNGG